MLSSKFGTERGIAKNGAQVFSLWAPANLYLARRTLASA
jgi:hypothetical protein